MPLRRNSRGIPGKNTRLLAGRPLFDWSLREALHSQCFGEIYLASDCAATRAMARDRFGSSIFVINRSAATASDTASSESLLLEVQSRINFDVVCLVQATSPLTCREDFVQARHHFEEQALDSLLSAVPFKRFVWTADGHALNYDPKSRPRRQTFAKQFMENGAFYFTKAAVLKNHRCRLGGRVGIHEMHPDSGIEIDEPADWEKLETLLLRRLE